MRQRTRPGQMRPRFLYGVIALALAMVATACETPDPEAVPDPEDPAEAADDQNGDDVGAVDTDVTLEIWIGRENYEPDQGFEAFTEETGIGVNVDVLPLEDATTDFIRAYQADNEPDIFQIEIDLWMALVEAGVVRDLSDLWEQWESEDPDHFNNMAAHAFGELVHEGGSYGLTAHTQPHLFGYRPDILDQVGVDQRS